MAIRHIGRLAGTVAPMLAILAALFVAEIAAASPAAAHGVGGRSDLPLPLWKMAWAAAAAVLVSFAGLGVLWTRPRLAAAKGREITGVASSLLKGLGILGSVGGLVMFFVLMSAGLLGSDTSPANPLPWAIYIVIWVGVLLVCALVGDVWRPISPVVTLTRIGRRLLGCPEELASGGLTVEAATVEAATVEGLESDSDADPSQSWLSDGSAVGAALLFGFMWIELAYFDSASPRMLGWVGVVTTFSLVALALSNGTKWLLGAAGFPALFGLVAAMAPIGRDTPDGPLRLRAPLTGLGRVVPRRGTLAMVMVVLGGTTFDGVSRTALWQNIVDEKTEWSWTIYQTFGLIWTILVVAMAFALAIWAMARITGDDAATLADHFTPSLAPIVVAYAVAHYFSLLIFEGQAFLINMSDPWAKGWDLFGTADWLIDYTLVDPSTISWVQAGSIVVGHVAAVVAAHDRSLELFDEQLAVRSQLPMLAVMVAYTVAGLFILLSG